MVIPSFRRGSGGHATIANRAAWRRAEPAFLVDQQERHPEGDDVEALFEVFFGPVEAPVLRGVAPVGFFADCGWSFGARA